SDPAIRRNASPWEGTLTLYPFVNVPRSARAQRSRTVALPVASPISLQVTVIVVVAVPRFRSPTARTPDPARGLYQTWKPAAPSQGKGAIVAAVHGACCGCDVQSSLMSADTRHWCAVTGPQAHGSSVGELSLALRTIDRPEATMASRQRA